MRVWTPLTTSSSPHLMSVVFARRNSRIDHMRRPWSKNDALAKQREIWRKIFTSSRTRTKLRFMFLVKLRQCRRPLQREARGARIRSRFRSIDAHDEQERIKLRRDGHSKEVQKPHRSVGLLMRMCTPTRRHKCSFMIWLESVRNLATTRRIAQALQRSRILIWVGQRSKTTVDQRGVDNCMRNGQLRTSCCSKFWEQFVVNIDIEGFVFNKASSRPKWRTSPTRVVRITLETSKQK